MESWSTAGVMFLLAIVVVGCGGPTSDKWTQARPTVYPVSGILLMDGEPLEGATVTYHSQSEELSATGRTDAAGKYRLTTFDPDDGAVEGNHRVVLSKREWISKPTRHDSPSEPAKALFPQERLPARYADPESTELTVIVPANGVQDHRFEISSK